MIISNMRIKNFTILATKFPFVYVPRKKIPNTLEELKRISKNLVFLKKISSINETQGKRFFDYSSKYKMKLYKTLEKNVGNLSPSIPLGTIRMSGIFLFQQ